MRRASLLAALLLCALGQRPALVECVVDGDTIVVGGLLISRVIGPNLRIDTVAHGKVRFLGVSAPERREPGGAEAKAWMEARLSQGEAICVEGFELDAFGRILARVHDSDGDVGDGIVAAGLAVGAIGPRPVAP